MTEFLAFLQGILVVLVFSLIMWCFDKLYEENTQSLLQIYHQSYKFFSLQEYTCVIPFKTEAITEVVCSAIPRSPTSNPTHLHYLLHASSATSCTREETANIRLCEALTCHFDISISSHLFRFFIKKEPHPSQHARLCFKIRHFPGGCPRDKSGSRREELERNRAASSFGDHWASAYLPTKP